MVGRRPKPAGLKMAQGNPGRRPLHDVQDKAPVAGSKANFRFAKLTKHGRDVYSIISSELRRLNFVKTSDEMLVLRYADAIARYWRVTNELNKLGSEHYESPSIAGGTMYRIRPQFIVQQRLEMRIEAMEDRLGLSPMARQQFLSRLASLGMQPSLPGLPVDGAENLPQAVPGSPVGLLKRANVLN